MINIDNINYKYTQISKELTSANFWIKELNSEIAAWQKNPGWERTKLALIGVACLAAAVAAAKFAIYLESLSAASWVGRAHLKSPDQFMAEGLGKVLNVTLVAIFVLPGIYFIAQCILKSVPKMQIQLAAEEAKKKKCIAELQKLKSAAKELRAKCQQDLIGIDAQMKQNLDLDIKIDSEKQLALIRTRNNVSDALAKIDTVLTECIVLNANSTPHEKRD